MNNLKLILQFNKLFIVLSILAFTYVFIFTVIIKYESKYQGSETEIVGKITEYSINGNKLKMTISAKEDVIANYYINTKEEKEWLLKNIAIGQKIHLQGKLEKPIANTIPNNFNYQKYLYQQKIFYLFSVDNYEIVGNNNIIDKIKDFLLKRSYKLDNGDYLLVLVLGDKSLISSDEYTNYQINGTSHLLAISGSHVTVILAVFSFILKKLKSIPRLIILSFILIFFGFLTNFQAAVNRAIIFFILNQVNKIGCFNYSNLQILFFTAFILLVFNPFIVFDLGFIYSLIVCGGIIYNSEKITGNYFVKLFKLSLIAFLFSLPISAYLNYEINIMSILVNMVFVPWISCVVFPLAIITFIFPFLNPLLNITLIITRLLNDFFANISIFVNIPKMPFIMLFGLFIFILLCKNNKKYFFGVIGIIAVIKLLPLLDSNYYLYFFDVGQGDCTLLVSPYKKDVIMIDTGGKISYETDEWKISNKTYNLSDNVIKFLKSIGVTKLNYLILSHGDVDHAKEAINIINNVDVRYVIFNNDSFNDLELDIIDTLNKNKMNYYQNIKEVAFYKTKLYFFNSLMYDNENDNSNVIYGNLNNVKILFMGDAGVNVESDLINKYNLSNIDILKVGHHGSKTSTSKYLINTTNPLYAIISVGRNNRYNHPNEEVLEVLKNSHILRTDIYGTIVFKIKSSKLQVEYYSPKLK